ncbi:MAG TPA: M13 family peptidase [Flavobacteriia bacterium]|nr:M13 family peptidase [Flavobacteriia bacterium]
MKTINSIIAISIAITLFSCKTQNRKKIKKEIEIPGIVLENMDTLVSPKEDFFKYVNGNWLAKTKIPEDRTSWGSFNELRKRTDDDVLAILDDEMKNTSLKDAKQTETTDQQKAVYLFQSYINLKDRNKNGIKPIEPILKKVNQIKDLNDAQNFMAETQPYGGAGFFGIYVGSHPKKSDKNAVFLYPAGLGLSRDYYVDQDADTKEKLKKYQEHIARMLQFIKEQNTTDKAKKIVAFETELAKPRMTKEERRDARKRYNPMSIEEIAKMTKVLDMKKYFKDLGIKNTDTLIVTDPNYFKALNEVLAKTDVNTINDYLKWTVIDHAAGSLSEDIDKANWEFYSKTLRGSKQQRPIKERGLSVVNGSIGEALGKLYVDKKFPPEAKEKAEKMIKNIFRAFESRIKNVDWMSDKTKENAIVKLHKMTFKIAYPDKWKDYSKLDVAKEKSYFDNRMAVSKFNFDKNLHKIGKPVDKTEWYMSPQTVNAYFNPPNNEIVFPAAILQPPFYNYNADDAVNYGGIGAVIGHEVSHSFDDSGARYDGDGNLNNWWTKEDEQNFAKRGEKLAKQFSEIEALPGVHLNGEFNLGENIGDLGGVNVAYDALQLDFKETKKPGKIDGFTPEQRYFMSWATVWRTKMREDALRNLIKTNPHAPGMYRAYMPLKNVDAFYEAFDIKEGDKMYLKPEDRVKIW